jgi:hypothetical protein
MRLIDADELKKAFIDEWNYEADYAIFRQVENIIDNAPTVEQKYYERVIAQIKPVIEARPQDEITEEDIQNAIKAGYENGYSMAQAKYQRPQGEWIIVKDEKYGDNVKCPFCGKELAGTDLNFCCKCGADMRGKEE